MKKSIARIVISSLAFSTVFTGLSFNNMEIGITKAYASTDSSDTELSKLKLKTSSGSNINIYDDDDYKSKNKVDSNEIEPDTQYYAKTSSGKIKIDVDGVDDDCVRLFVKEKDSAKGVKVGKTASLSSGTNKVTVRVYNSDPGSSVKYEEDDDVANDYTIKVKYNNDDDDDDDYDYDDDDDDDYDDVFLKSISLSDGEINFSKRTSKYNVYVGSSVDSITIKAKPEDDDYTVTIDGTDVDDDDNYKEEVSLNKGKNTIEIEVEDEDEDDYRVYTLYIYRGETANGTSSSINNNGSNNINDSNKYNPVISSPAVTTQVNYQPTNGKINQWVMNNGKWQYIDSLGKPLTSQWFLDKNLGKYYYLGADGNMATGWIYISGQWYLLDGSGAMLTGWQYSNGKWYYLNPVSGAMVTNSYVGSYRVDSTGAMV